MNWLARYRDSFEQETKLFENDILDCKQKKKYPKAEKEIEAWLSNLGKESFKEYDLSYMIVSEDQIKKLKEETEKVNALIAQSGVKEDDEEFKTFKKIFDFEEKDDEEQKFNKKEEEVQKIQTQYNKALQNKTSLEEKEDEMRNVLSLLTEYALYLQSEDAEYKKYYEENVIAKKKESFDEIKKILQAGD